MRRIVMHMAEMERVPRGTLDDAKRISHDEVEEGQEYIFKWYPYTWAREQLGYVGVVRVTVTDVIGFVGDIKMETESGVTLTDLGEGRRQVMGPAPGIEGTPDWTDVGHGGTWYIPPDELVTERQPTMKLLSGEGDTGFMDD